MDLQNLHQNIMRNSSFFLNFNRLKHNKLSTVILYCRIHILHCLTIAFILTTSQIFYSPSFVAHETFLNNNSTLYNSFVQCGNNFLTSFCFVVSCATNLSVDKYILKPGAVGSGSIFSSCSGYSFLSFFVLPVSV